MPVKPPVKRKNDTPVNSTPQKSLREMLQEMANRNTVEAARQGFEEIDRHKRRISRKLKEFGITGADEILEQTSVALKRKAIELMSGRPQK